MEGGSKRTHSVVFSHIGPEPTFHLATVKRIVGQIEWNFIATRRHSVTTPGLNENVGRLGCLLDCYHHRHSSRESFFPPAYYM